MRLSKDRRAIFWWVAVGNRSQTYTCKCNGISLIDVNNFLSYLFMQQIFPECQPCDKSFADQQ